MSLAQFSVIVTCPTTICKKKREKCRTRARLYLIVRQGASAEMLPTLLTTTPQRQCLLAMFTCLPTKIEMSLYVYITSAVLEKKKRSLATGSLHTVFDHTTRSVQSSLLWLMGIQWNLALESTSSFDARN